MPDVHDLVVFGSARMDAFLMLPNNKVEQHCSLDTKRCKIELSYSAKLGLDDAVFEVGGNGANVAVGVTRLGRSATLVAELGEGPLADHAHSELAKELDMGLVSRTAGVREGFGAVIVYQGERTILSYYSPKRPPFPHDIPSAPWAYLTSVGDKFEEYYDDVLVWLSKHDARLVFNPGGRQIAKDGEWLKRFLERTEVLIVNREEAEAIVKSESSLGREKELIDSLFALGPKIVVVTDGPAGSYAATSGKYYKMGIYPVDAIERTGAGDSYSTGLIAAYLDGRELPEAMLWGTLNAASVIGYIGPEDGLLKKEKMEEWIKLAEGMSLKAEEF